MADFGQTSSTDANSGSYNAARAMGGTFVATDGVLQSVSLYIGGDTKPGRVSVYIGGALDDPSGATLLEDLGEFVTTSGNQFYTFNSVTNPTIPADSIVWVAVKNSNDFSAKWSTSSSFSGDWQSGRGRYNSTAISSDETVAFPDPWPSDGGSFGNFWYPFYLTYTEATGNDPISDLSDNYDDDSIGAQWSDESTGTGTSIAEQDGRLEKSLADSESGSNFAVLESVDQYDMTGDGVFVRLDVSDLKEQAGAIGGLAVLSATDALWIEAENGSLWARGDITGSEQSTSLTGDFVWVRIREDSGTLFWDYVFGETASPGTWTNLRSADLTDYSEGVEALQVQTYGGTSGSVASPGKVYFDGLNTDADVAAATDAARPLINSSLTRNPLIGGALIR